MSTIKLQAEIMDSNIVKAGEPFTQDDISISDVQPSTVYEALKRLAQAGKLRNLGEGVFVIVKDMSGYARKSWRKLSNEQLGIKWRAL